jgi:hypothetical protein
VIAIPGIEGRRVAKSPLVVAIVLLSSRSGVIVPILKDSGNVSSAQKPIRPRDKVTVSVGAITALRS